MGVAKDDYNASTWQPHLVVVYVGSNDYINQVTPSANEFKEAYSAMVKRILDTHGSKVAVLHLCGNIKDPQATRTPCDYIKDVAAAAGQNYSSTMDTETPAGCVGHRTARQQAALASRVAPIIATLCFLLSFYFCAHVCVSFLLTCILQGYPIKA